MYSGSFGGCKIAAYSRACVCCKMSENPIQGGAMTTSCHAACAKLLLRQYSSHDSHSASSSSCPPYASSSDWPSVRLTEFDNATTSREPDCCQSIAWVANLDLLSDGHWICCRSSSCNFLLVDCPQWSILLTQSGVFCPHILAQGV